MATAKITQNRSVRSISILSVMIALLGSASSTLAQDAVPDLSGNWWRTQDRSGNTGRVLQESPRVLSEHGEALMAVFDPADDPAARCEHPGAVRVILSPYPINFELHGDFVAISYEEWATTRIVQLTEQDADPDVPHTLMGRSVGRYEDGSLIIETSDLATGLNMSTGFFWTSEEANVLEEYFLVEDNTYLTLRMTLTDPVMLTEPWVIEKRWVRYDGELLDFECIDRERPEPITGAGSLLPTARRDPIG